MILLKRVEKIGPLYLHKEICGADNDPCSWIVQRQGVLIFPLQLF